MKTKSICLSLVLIWMFCTIASSKAQAAAQTTTSLTVTSTNGVVTTVTFGSAVTLTATVQYGSTAATVGQVNFCDATAASCTDIHLLGTAQLTSTGTASIKFIPAIGSHTYKAVFAGTPHGTTSLTGSTSATKALSVTGLWPSVTAIVADGSPGNYTLTATTGGVGNTAPTGSVSLVDTSNNNDVLGSASLTTGPAGLNFLYSLNFSQITLHENSPLQFVVSDFNGDGIPDIAAGSSFGCPGTHCGNATLTTLLGDGNGNFTADAPLDLGSSMSMSFLAAGDFNGDGIPDLVIGNGMLQEGSQSITILLGNGKGTFTVGGTTTTNGTFQSLAIADFNGDGIPDVAVANTTANLITILLGKGDGTFTASPAAPSSTTSQIIATGDFNGDELPDLIGINSNNDSLTILFGNGDGTFTEKTPGPVVGSGSTSIAVGDFNGDGKSDLAVANPQTAMLAILLGNGDGTFTSAAGSPIQLQSMPFVGNGISLTGDFNGDGKVDLVAEGFLLLGNGTGSFSLSPLNVIGAGAIDTDIILAAGDFNGDGTTDLASLGAPLMATPQTATATIQSFAVPVATGNHQVEANYAGDTDYSASTSGMVVLAASPGTSTVQVTSSAAQVFSGTQVTLTATVTGSGLTPTGTVRFYAGSSLLGEATLNSSGVATYTTNSLPVGNNNITASYEGDTNYTSANSQPIVVVVAAPGTTTPTMTVTPSASNVTNQQSITVMVSVAGATGQPAPTGVLDLTTGSYSAQQSLMNGAASFMLQAGVLSSGSNALNVTYLGDATYKSVSGSSTVTVSRVLIMASTPAPVSPGASSEATISLSSGSTYSGTMNLSCALSSSPPGAQSLPTCSLNPANLAIATGGNGTATLTLKTSAPTNNARGSGLDIWGIGGSSIMACLIVFGMPSLSRRWKSILGCLLILFVTGAIGCGGGSSSKPPVNPGTPGTTAGNYTFTVTGTDTADSSITVSSAVTLTVQ